MRLVAWLLLAASWGAAEARPAIAAGAHYVAMGSSFASGPGVTVSADTPTNRCARSKDNYAHRLARKLQLDLTDVSCGGATTAHILGQWNELPPQIDALRPDTRLVTVTIGGNDVGFIGGLIGASCAADSANAMCKGFAARSAEPQRPPPEPDADAWKSLEGRLNTIAAEVKRRSPRARLIFVDYLTIVPNRATCRLAPLDPLRAGKARAKAARLAALTADAARRAGAGLIRASRLSAGHDACAIAPWVSGLIADGVPYHPNLAGMTAISDALERELGKK